MREHEVLALYGVAKSIVNQDTDYILIDDAYDEYQKGIEEYQEICETMHNNNPDKNYDEKIYVIRPISKESFKGIIYQLTLLNLIISRPISSEKAIYKISLLDISIARFIVLLKKAVRSVYLPLFS